LLALFSSHKNENPSLLLGSIDTRSFPYSQMNHSFSKLAQKAAALNFRTKSLMLENSTSANSPKYKARIARL
jgi:hypothetical protein